MGAIEDVYEDLEADVDFEEFEAAVHEKVEQMGGLADEETAAMLIAHELRDEEVETVADVEPGMDEVKFLAKVVSVGELRTFERDDGEDGRVVNVTVADESGQVRVALWDEMADAAVDELEVGTVLRVAGRPKDGYDGVEVSADRVEEDEDAEVDVDVSPDGRARVEDLALGRSDVTLVGVVLDTDSVRSFDRDDGSEGRVANLVVGDETGRVRVTLWDEKADRAEELSPGETVEVVDGYVRERDGDLELHVGSRGAVDVVDADVEYVPETTPIADVEIDRTVDVAGGVIEADPKRTFDRDDGSEGQVRNVRIKDETGDIRVALWGEKADATVELGDYVVCTDVQIQEGWQDDLEASANWRSTVSVVDRPDGAGGAGGAGTDDGGAPGGSAGLGAFADGADAGGSDGADATGGADPAGATATDAAGADEGPAEGDRVEFTGTVVQAGSPVVLDDGRETRSVETEETLRLGEEVTVVGVLRDGRIDATEVRSETG
jgi:replication factor A1